MTKSAVYSFRFDEKKMEQVFDKGLFLHDLKTEFDKVIDKLIGHKGCPVCGRGGSKRPKKKRPA